MTTFHDQHNSPYWEARATKERDEDERRRRDLHLLAAIFALDGPPMEEQPETTPAT